MKLAKLQIIVCRRSTKRLIQTKQNQTSRVPRETPLNPYVTLSLKSIKHHLWEEGKEGMSLESSVGT